ncbi:MAG TPA: hypothetical protein VI976_01845, partial [Candidatus Omnitrophota bacterium]|nr:hypothetical protein [Candidatus Omnitrophota bacterium]
GRMKRAICFLVSFALLILALNPDVSASGILWEEISRGNTNLTCVLTDPVNPRIIYFGSQNGIYKTSDGGLNWRSILSVRGQKRIVHFLLFDPKNKNSLYAATGTGLFYSADQGASWRRIFKGKNYLESECLALAILADSIYLGTAGGLFLSKDKGRSWHKEKGGLGRAEILAIAFNSAKPNEIYAACIEGVFRTDNYGQSWEKIFAANPSEGFGGEDEGGEGRDEGKRYSNIRHLILDAHNSDSLYLATSKGVYKSRNKGRDWELVSSYGLLSEDIRFLLIASDYNFYCLTKSGVFKYDDERWQELSLGLAVNEIRFLAWDKEGNLYAACDSGLFKAKIMDDFKQEALIALYCKFEPAIKEVQQAAITYAEVEPEKIIRWRRQARMKAALPKLTVGLDRSEATNYEIYTSGTTRYVYEGPHDRSNGWDVTLSWELGDLIWSGEQTNIDVRSKLMVELRDNILDEVNKLYFERLRVKMELDSLSIEDRRKRLEKELRLRELTASLDALTGGWFSRYFGA